MNTLRCLYRDRLLRKLVDTYSQLEKRDMAAVVAGTEVPPQVEDLQLTLADHLASCPVCLRNDSAGPEVERAGIDAPTPKVQPIG